MSKFNKISLKGIAVITLLIFISVIIIRTIITNRMTDNLNIILISADALRSDHMGVYGYGKNTTPNIDRWARTATVFTDVFTATPKTYASFTSLFTGLKPTTTGIYDFNGKALNPVTETLSKILKSNGYYNAAFVNTSVLNSDIDGNPTNLQLGFDEWHYINYSAEDANNHPGLSVREEYEKHILSGVEWLKNNKNKKFFLWIYLLNPHAPYDPPDDLKCKFNSQYCTVISKLTSREIENERKILRGKSNGCVTDNVSTDKVEFYKTLYDGNIAYADRLIGKILDKVSDLGLKKNTVILFYSDHGEGFDHNYNFQHGNLYQSNIKIPLIIEVPYLKKQNAGFFMENSDILPTILDILKINKKSYKFDGESYFSLQKYNWTEGADSVTKNKLIFSYNHNLRYYAIHDLNYKYIYAIDEKCLFSGEKEEFYDLKNDPQEQKNLIQEKKNLADVYKKELFDHLDKHNLPYNNTTYKKFNSEEQKRILDKLNSLDY